MADWVTSRQFTPDYSRRVESVIRLGVLVLALLGLAGCRSLHAGGELVAIEIPGFHRRAVIDQTTTGPLRALIRASNLEQYINDGEFSVNALRPGGVSILVLAAQGGGGISLGAVNGAYDRTADVLLLDETVVPAYEVVARWSAGEEVSAEELGHIRFCQFIMLHELGHREVGDKNRTRFYSRGTPRQFADRFLSEEQMEELRADRWALDALLAAAGPLDARGRASVLKEVAEQSLYRFFGSWNRLDDIPYGHPSMFYRVASVYNSASRLLSLEEQRAFWPEASRVWELGGAVEGHLKGIILPPKNVAVEDVVASADGLYVLGTDGRVFREDTWAVLYGSQLGALEPKRPTIRRYTSSRLDERKVIGTLQATEDRRKLVAAGDTILACLVGQDGLRVLNLEAEALFHLALPGGFGEGAQLAALSADEAAVRGVLRSGSQAIIFSFDFASRCTASWSTDLDVLADPELVEVVGMRGDTVLAHVSGEVSEIWALRAESEPTFVVAMVNGALLGPSCEIAGLALIGSGRGELVDAATRTSIDLDRSSCGLSNLETIYAATKFLRRDGPPLSKLTDLWMNPLPDVDRLVVFLGHPSCAFIVSRVGGVRCMLSLFHITSPVTRSTRHCGRTCAPSIEKSRRND